VMLKLIRPEIEHEFAEAAHIYGPMIRTTSYNFRK
jgi:hypothetical protein